MSSQNAQRAATVGYYMNPSDYSTIPKGQMMNTDYLYNATSKKGVLNMTQFDTRTVDSAVKACASMTDFKKVKASNYKITANETGCGWVTTGNNKGQGILGNYTTTLGPLPPSAQDYYSPIATRSANPDALKIPCGSDNCSKPSEGFSSNQLTEAFTTLAPASAFAPPFARDPLVSDSKEGTQIAALYASTNPSIYDDALFSESSYKIYDNVTSVNPNVIPGSMSSVHTALLQFPDTNPSRESNTGYAPRDILLERVYDQYTFCNDPTDTTIINSTNLVCIQRIWIQRGGKTTDKDYPTLQTWNGRTYGQFKKVVMA